MQNILNHQHLSRFKSDSWGFVVKIYNIPECFITFISIVIWMFNKPLKILKTIYLALIIKCGDKQDHKNRLNKESTQPGYRNKFMA
jgi:hypothetical protein